MHFTREEITALIDEGIIETLEDHEKAHRAYVRKRVEDTHLAEGAKPEFVRSASLHQLEYGNIGSGVASPEFLRQAIICLESYSTGHLYVISADGELERADKDILDALDPKKHHRVWAQATVDLAGRISKDPTSYYYKNSRLSFPQPVKQVISGYGDCGTSKILTPQGLSDLAEIAFRIPLDNGRYGHYHGRQNGQDDTRDGQEKEKRRSFSLHRFRL